MTGKQATRALASALIHKAGEFLCLFRALEAAGSGGFRIHAFWKTQGIRRVSDICPGSSFGAGRIIGAEHRRSTDNANHRRANTDRAPEYTGACRGTTPGAGAREGAARAESPADHSG